MIDLSKLDEKALEAAAKALNDLWCPTCQPYSATGDAHIQYCEKSARAAITAYLAAMPSGWQPIETAPRGAQLILGNSEKRWIRFGRFYPEFRKWYYSGTNERQQYSETEGGVPTHWRPIPTLPRSGDAQ